MLNKLNKKIGKKTFVYCSFKTSVGVKSSSELCRSNGSDNSELCRSPISKSSELCKSSRFGISELRISENITLFFLQSKKFFFVNCHFRNHLMSKFQNLELYFFLFEIKATDIGHFLDNLKTERVCNTDNKFI